MKASKSLGDANKPSEKATVPIAILRHQPATGNFLPFFSKNPSSSQLKGRITMTKSPPIGHPLKRLTTRQHCQRGTETKDQAMSNDIQPNAPRAPAAPAEIPAARAAEVQTRPQPPVEKKPAVENKPDPHEARRTLQEASEQLNKQMAKNGRDLSFSVDDVANKVVLTVKNREGEVVRQIPNEVVLRVAHNMEDMKGLMQDDKS
jgi:flagellar protein FlaG